MNHKPEAKTATRVIWVSYSRQPVVFLLAIVLTAFGSIALGSPPTPTEALSLRPVQSGILYDTVNKADEASCLVKDLVAGDWGGWEVIAPDGRKLRVFADTNGDKKVDLWCYFSRGIEVYRDIDENFNGKADQYRWLGINGTKWGIDEDENGTVDSWMRISAEEVSAEVIRAIGSNNLSAFQAILATREELINAGLIENRIETLFTQVSDAKKSFSDFAQKQTQITNQTVWLQFAGQGPGTLPQSHEMTSADIMVYDNAVTLYQTPAGNEQKSGQLYLGPVLRVGENWRLLGLPTFDEQEALTESRMTFFDSLVKNGANDPPALTMSQSTEKLVNQLEAIDKTLMENMEGTSNASPQANAELNQRRADIIEKLIDAADSPTESNSWCRQLIDTLAISAQMSEDTKAAERLATLAKRLDSEKSDQRAYARFQSVTTNYLVKQLIDEDFAAVQRTYLSNLEKFVKDFPTAPEAAEAWKQLALQKEFENDTQTANEIYRKIVDQFPNSPQSEIAAGAIRRIESVGKRIDLKGSTIGGARFQLSNLRGKMVVIHYWATWCSPCLQDIRALQQLQVAYQGKGLEFVGINVDLNGDQTRKFLQENPIPWTQLFEAGGLEGSGLSKALGIQTLPAMLLIDEEGRVVFNNLQINQLQQELAQRVR